MTLPPFFTHSSALLTSTKPLALQEFLPLQVFSAPAQPPWPLHALIPAQCTSLPVLSVARAATLPASTRAAAALAISIPRPTPFILAPPFSSIPRANGAGLSNTTAASRPRLRPAKRQSAGILSPTD